MSTELTKHLTTEETNRYYQLKAKCKSAWIDLATSLLEIHNRKLYLVEYDTFEEFCKGELQIARRTGYQFIEAAKVLDNVRNCAHDILPATESQARPLTKLEPELQREAWQETLARNNGNPVTAAKVEEVVSELVPVNERFKELKADNGRDIFNPSPRSNNDLLQEAKRERHLSALEERQEVKEIEPPLVASYDANMFFKSGTRSPDRYGDKVFSLTDDKYNTVSTLSRFFHTETMCEFSLREYAYVQTFPDSYKFVGSYTTIKKQIGNAVAPYMGRYVTQGLDGKTIGDLFAGCGGFSCGAHQNGKTTKWAVEWEEPAAMSYKLNFPDTKVFNTNIKALDPADFSPVDIIIGGPPCQGFSSANHENKKVAAADRFADDPRNELYKEFLRFVKHLMPGEFIMENVPEIQDVKEQIIEDFTSIGYEVTTELVVGNDIGMKQNRKRFFFYGKKM